MVLEESEDGGVMVKQSERIIERREKRESLKRRRESLPFPPPITSFFQQLVAADPEMCSSMWMVGL